MTNPNDKALGFWEQQFKDSATMLDLPTDHPRSAIQNFKKGLNSFSLSQKLSKNLRAFCQRADVTPFVFYLTAYSVFIFRYTHQENFFIGSYRADIISADENDIPTVPFSFIPFNTDLSGEPSFWELLNRFRHSIHTVEKYDVINLEKFVEDLQMEDLLITIPLIQALFIYQKTTKKLGSHSVTEFLNEQQKNNFELALYINETNRDISGYFEYNKNLYNSSKIIRMIGNFKKLLSSIIAKPKSTITSLPLLTKSEKEKILVEWNNTETHFPENTTITHLFEAQANRTPKSVALIYQDQKLTYDALNRRSNKLAHYLRKQGVGPDIPVGICVDRSLEMVVGLLGILKAGGSYLPLDPNYPASRLSFMIDDAAPPFLLTRARIAEKLPSIGAHIITLDTQLDSIFAESTENIESNVTPDNLAYIIYTSGSTGKPKGAMIPHKAISNHMNWLLAEFNINHSDRILQKTPFSFDASVWEFYAPILVGGQLIMAVPGGHQDGEYLVQTIIQQGITVIQLVPSQLQLLLDTPDFIRCRSLRHVFCGGEPLQVEMINRFYQQLPGVQLTNLYGPSESTIDTSFWPCVPLAPQTPVPIGKPISNVQAYILDHQMQPVPIGVSGELYIGGKGVGKGYLNRPELTSNKFVKSPFRKNPEERLYKTGDKVRFGDDGNIIFLGRYDDQVKIRGFRIELGEIEAVLNSHPAVQRVVVLVREDSPGEKRLAAYIVLTNHTSPTVNEWRQFLGQSLPEYMIPSAFVLLDEFPLSPNGKVNRKALPVPEINRSSLESDFVAPRSETERILATIWAKVLKINRVGVFDNFYDLGGDSIRSIHITSQANQAGIQIKPSQVLEQQTIAELAVVADTTPIVRAEQGLVTGEMPLAPGQKRFFEQGIQEPNHRCETIVLEVPREVDASLLEKAIQHLLVHHDALRLRFTRNGTTWQPIIAGADENILFSHINCHAARDDERKSVILSVLSELEATLDISDGPMLRSSLIDFEPGAERYFILVIHHLVVDGVSWRILLAQLDMLYRQLGQDQPPRLPSKTSSIKDWSLQLTDLAGSHVLKLELPTWFAMQDEKMARLPVDTPGDEQDMRVPSIDSITVSLGIEETHALMVDVPKAYRTLITDVLLAALVEVFTEWTGMPAFQVDIEGHGREPISENIDLSLTVGNFSAIYPVLLSPGITADVGDTLLSVKEILRQIPQGGIGYGLLRYLGSEENRERLQEISSSEVIFQYMGQLDTMLPDDSFLKLGFEFPFIRRTLGGYRGYKLEISSGIVNNRLHVAWRYDRNSYLRATVENLASGYMDSLRRLIEHCTSTSTGRYSPSDFPEAGLSQQELDELISEIDEYDE